MNEELSNRLYKLFSDEIQGGCTNDMVGMIDIWIEDGEITEDEARDNEMAIANLFDTHWFTCNNCGWTMPINEMADNDDWVCTDCAE